MEAIGGYFSLELNKGAHYHQDAIRLNTARNCFEYVLRVRKYKKIYLPYYTCEVMLEPLLKLNVAYEFYHINENFEPTELKTLKANEAFLYTNYYGLKQNTVTELAVFYKNQLIVDNAQAFFALPLPGIDTFYSARKFFGVPDGAYLYCNEIIEIVEQDYSYNRMMHLLKRIDLGAESGYSDFQKNDNELIGQPIKKMSKLTEALLSSINYTTAIEQRIANYNLLNDALFLTNTFSISLSENSVPMVYLFYSKDNTLRSKLIKNKFFAPTYWPNVLNWTKKDDLENELVKNIIPIPIDHRYQLVQMEKIIYCLTKII